jgi:hypothetical protein
MAAGSNGSRDNGRMTLIEAATFMERLQGRAAHARELEAMQIARDALLTIVSEGFVTLKDRLTRDGVAVTRGEQAPVQPPPASPAPPD